MSVEFENSGIARRFEPAEQKSGLLRFFEARLISIGVPEQYVSAVLACTMIAICIVSFFIFRGSITSDRARELTPQEQAKLLEVMPPDRHPFE